MKRRPRDGNARSLEPDTQLRKNIVNEALIARVGCQPGTTSMSECAVTGSMFVGAFISCSGAVASIDGTRYVVSPLHCLNGFGRNLLVSGKAKINIKEFRVEFGELGELKEARISRSKLLPRI